jgi:hypothetical protein
MGHIPVRFFAPAPDSVSTAPAAIRALMAQYGAVWWDMQVNQGKIGDLIGLFMARYDAAWRSPYPQEGEDLGLRRVQGSPPTMSISGKAARTPSVSPILRFEVYGCRSRSEADGAGGIWLGSKILWTGHRVDPCE